mmetsp:Transcript_7668/g.23179  ORF Transcript_7668/g.23179 Transcript_7668/m.23179 type:complete len:226 (-) Transcript_7668:758-1435(-)
MPSPSRRLGVAPPVRLIAGVWPPAPRATEAPPGVMCGVAMTLGVACTLGVGTMPEKSPDSISVRWLAPPISGFSSLFIRATWRMSSWMEVALKGVLATPPRCSIGVTPPGVALAPSSALVGPALTPSRSRSAAAPSLAISSSSRSDTCGAGSTMRVLRIWKEGSLILLAALICVGRSSALRFLNLRASSLAFLASISSLRPPSSAWSEMLVSSVLRTTEFSPSTS